MAQQEMFPATNGRGTGILGLLIAAGAAFVAITAVDQSVGFPLLAGAFLFALLTYAAVLRPRVGLADDDLVLRQMFSTTWIPLAAIEDIAVRRVTVIRVDGKTFSTPALAGPPRRLRDRWSEPEVDPRTPSAADQYTSKIHRAMAGARKRAKVKEGSEKQAALAREVRTEWHRNLVWLAIAGVVALVYAIVA